MKKKISSVTGLVTTATTTLNTKATEIKNKIPVTTGFITTPEFNKIAKIDFDARKKETWQRTFNQRMPST